MLHIIYQHLKQHYPKLQIIKHKLYFYSPYPTYQHLTTIQLKNTTIEIATINISRTHTITKTIDLNHPNSIIELHQTIEQTIQQCSKSYTTT